MSEDVFQAEGTVVQRNLRRNALAKSRKILELGLKHAVRGE